MPNRPLSCNARAPLTKTSFHPLGTKYVGNITVKTGRRLSSVTFTVHRRNSGAQSAKEENIITRFINRTATECAVARSLTSLPACGIGTVNRNGRES
jgi:hypothetical protein